MQAIQTRMVVGKLANYLSSGCDTNGGYSSALIDPQYPARTLIKLGSCILLIIPTCLPTFSE
ncbi:MAG: hypothetical protein ACOVN8_05590, partial [Burkholderiaceae bacterium]